MTHQRRAQLRNIANGMCQMHRTRPLAEGSRVRCETCLKAEAERQRQRRRCSRAYPEKAVWKKLDWSQTDEIISKELKVLPGTVRIQRLRHTGLSKPFPLKWRCLADIFGGRSSLIAEAMTRAAPPGFKWLVNPQDPDGVSGAFVPERFRAAAPTIPAP